MAADLHADPSPQLPVTEQENPRMRDINSLSTLERRMKAGTAKKLVLNMLSTATVIRLGYVTGKSTDQHACAQQQVACTIGPDYLRQQRSGPVPRLRLLRCD